MFVFVLKPFCFVVIFFPSFSRVHRWVLFNNMRCPLCVCVCEKKEENIFQLLGSGSEHLNACLWNIARVRKSLDAEADCESRCLLASNDFFYISDNFCFDFGRDLFLRRFWEEKKNHQPHSTGNHFGNLRHAVFVPIRISINLLAIYEWHRRSLPINAGIKRLRATLSVVVSVKHKECSRRFMIVLVDYTIGAWLYVVFLSPENVYIFFCIFPSKQEVRTRKALKKCYYVVGKFLEKADNSQWRDNFLQGTFRNFTTLY